MARDSGDAGVPAPAFIHIDLDNFWAVASCYGLNCSPALANYLYDDALQRAASLLDHLGLPATLFALGRDIENPGNAARLRALVQRGHALANHSYSHDLGFRLLDEATIEREVRSTHDLITAGCGYAPMGFRAPGYGASPALIRVLTRLGYAYDSSVMPSPWGWVFRHLDASMRRRAGGGAPVADAKSQFPRWADRRAPMVPYPPDPDDPARPAASLEHANVPRLIEYPVAFAPLLRLPFQAGVCMSLGQTYFRTLLRGYASRPAMPMIFLAHLADFADFRALSHPFFSHSGFFRHTRGGQNCRNASNARGRQTPQAGRPHRVDTRSARPTPPPPPVPQIRPFVEPTGPCRVAPPRHSDRKPFSHCHIFRAAVQTFQAISGSCVRGTRI